MKADAFVAWLKSVKLTAPFTMDDAKALKAMIEDSLGNAVVEVAFVGSRTDKVFVMAKRDDVTIARVIDVE